ncbi:MAG: LrgB family protein [Lachnospiraceae bacterium]|nr:LrgB family protein [Lachnospiraceae bacterium]
MNELLSESIYFGIVISLVFYWIAMVISKKVKITLCNPLLLSVLLVILVLVVFDIDYETYNYGAQYLTYFLTPATVCLAVPLYRQFKILKKNVAAIMLSIGAGCISHAIVMGVMTLAFQMSPELKAALIPKSLTTAIAIGVSQELGGITSVTVISVVITGILGATIAEKLFQLLKIKEPIAQGLACGTASHAIGTSKAMELGEIQGAMSSLAIVVTGILTVVLAPFIMEIIR